MGSATLYRSVYKPSASRLDSEPIYLGEEVVFHGELTDALSIANALPVADKVVATLETDRGDFHCNDFDKLGDGWTPRDVDFAHGELTIRVTKDALGCMHGDRLRFLRSVVLLDDHLDEIKFLVHRKVADGDIVDEDGKRIVLIEASDLTPTSEGQPRHAA